MLSCVRKRDEKQMFLSFLKRKLTLEASEPRPWCKSRLSRPPVRAPVSQAGVAVPAPGDTSNRQGGLRGDCLALMSQHLPGIRPPGRNKTFQQHQEAQWLQGKHEMKGLRRAGREAQPLPACQRGGRTVRHSGAKSTGKAHQNIDRSCENVLKAALLSHFDEPSQAPHGPSSKQFRPQLSMSFVRLHQGH